jgi:alpha-tubulin suppressor-like RCC1 family protein
MRKEIFLAAICCYTVSLCQVGINTQNPQGALHIQNTSKEMGVVLPVVSEALSTVTPNNTTAIEATFVYDNTLKCVRIKTDTKWSGCLLDEAGVTTIINNTYNNNGSTATNGIIKAIDADGDFLYQSVYINASDKNVYTMGYGGLGAVGTNNMGYQQIPVKIIAEACTDVASGYYSGYAITATGKLYSWGYNIYGKNGLDYPTVISTNIPTEVIMPSGIKPVKVESSNLNTIVLGNDGKLYTMGANFNYMNGNNTNTGYISTPTQINSGSLNGVTIVDFAMAQDKVCAIDSTGKLHYWGYNLNNQNTSPSTTGWTQIPTQSTIFTGGASNSATFAKSVALSTYSCIVLDGSGKIHGFGNNNEISGGAAGNSYNLSNNVTIDPGETIVKVKGMDGGVGIGSFALITKQSNPSVKPNVYASGYNYYGKMGTPDEFGFINNSTSWQKVSTASMSISEKIVDVAIGYYHTLYITGDDNANGTIDTNDYNLFGAGYAFPGPLGSNYQNNPNIPTQLKN